MTVTSDSQNEATSKHTTAFTLAPNPTNACRMTVDALSPPQVIWPTIWGVTVEKDHSCVPIASKRSCGVVPWRSMCGGILENARITVSCARRVSRRVETWRLIWRCIRDLRWVLLMMESRKNSQVTSKERNSRRKEWHRGWVWGKLKISGLNRSERTKGFSRTD